MPSVRIEVEKPFEEKLVRAKQLVKMFANKNACVSCSFGKDSVVVLWLALQENPKITVIYNNTGIDWPEVQLLKKHFVDFWGINLIETKPKKSFWWVQEHILKKGLHRDDGKKQSDICCDYLKEGPFRTVVKLNRINNDLTGITAVASRHRMFTACQKGQEYFSKKDGVWKIHPILYWTPSEVWKFIHDNGIPENLAYKKYGLDRLGCMFCLSHRGWRAQLSRTNPKAYKFIQERYFHQKLLYDAFPERKEAT